MKKVLIALLVLAATAAFANTPNDLDAAIGNWQCITGAATVTDLEGDNGFTAQSLDTDIAGIFGATSDGWLFDPNDTTVNVTVEGDFFDGVLDPDKTYTFIFTAGPGDDVESGVFYTADFAGPGDYILTLDSYDGLGYNDLMDDVTFWIADDNYSSPVMPKGSTLTVRFNKAEQETEVPEPAAYAYALTGLGSLIGIKRRVKK
ncbi:MAG: hypothetical protein IJT09_00330 [Abditibacteriota bacterium]|nr:hypothetical protein [Abditibacteriota bacterium]